MTPDATESSSSTDRSVLVIGPGRAGSAFAGALERVGWEPAGVFGRGDDLASAPPTALVLIATPDDSIAAVAAELPRRSMTVVAHVAGSRTLEVLGEHPRIASIHPLQSIPRGEAGVDQLLSGGWFAVAGDAVAEQIVGDLGGRLVTVDDADRVIYHAVASIASNHLVALLGQVERLAAGIGVPFEAYLDLARGALDSTARVGPTEALTGPAARGDRATLDAHVAALPVDERATYVALMREAQRLAGQRARGGEQSP